MRVARRGSLATRVKTVRNVRGRVGAKCVTLTRKKSSKYQVQVKRPRLVGAVNRCARTGETQQMSPNARGGGRNLPVWASAAAAMTRLRRNKSDPARILSPSNAHILRRTVTHAARGRRKKVRGGGSVQNGGGGAKTGSEAAMWPF